ncbi:MAG: glycosyltransferase family 4 protein [Luteolibacter sp.]
MSCSLAIVTRSFAPYRFHFYEALRQSGLSDAVVVMEKPVAADHPWRQRPDEIFKGVLAVTGGGGLGFLRLWMELNRQQPKLLIVTEYSFYSAVAMSWGKAHGVPYVLGTETGENAPFYARKWYSDFWQPPWRRMADGILASTRMAEETGLRMGKPTLLAPHAVDASEYHPIERNGASDQVVFLCVGALIERKGVRELVEAGRILASRGARHFKVRLVGAGPLRSELEAAAADLPWLEVKPFVEAGELVREYQQADVFVLPTYDDTYAVVVHEAACCGLALLVSERAGAVEVLVRDQNSGLSFTPRDPAALAEVMERMLDEPELRRSSMVAARAVGRRYSVDHLARACAAWLGQFSSGEGPTENHPADNLS